MIEKGNGDNVMFDDFFAVKLHGKKAINLKVSPKMLFSKTGKDNLSISYLVRKSKSNIEFRKRVEKELLFRTTSNFHDFSLLMGLYFGVFNLYGYMYIDSNLKKELLKGEPSFFKTKKFLDNYEQEIFSYLEKKYHLDFSDYKQIYQQLFTVSPDSFYSDAIYQDIGKIIMGNQLYHQDHPQDKRVLGCEKLISYFDQKNQTDLEKKCVEYK